MIADLDVPVVVILGLAVIANDRAVGVVAAPVIANDHATRLVARRWSRMTAPSTSSPRR